MSSINVIMDSASVQISINGGEPINKSVKPVVTAEGSTLFFECDDIDEQIGPNEALTVNGVKVTEMPVATEYDEQARLFNAQMSDLFSGTGGQTEGGVTESDVEDIVDEKLTAETVVTGNIKIDTQNGGVLFMRSPNNTLYVIQVNDAGELVISTD